MSAAGIVSVDTTTALHRWRGALNPEHHIWMGANIENQRTTAREFMEFVFHALVPVN